MRRIWKIILILSLAGNVSIVYVGYKALKYRSYINYWLEKYTQVVSEFSARNKYGEENRRLKSVVQVGNRVVFFGSQITENWNLPDLFPQFETVNRGVTGQRVGGFLLRFVPDVLELYPKAVVIEISSYNFRAECPIKEIMDYTVSLADLARSRNVEPIIGTVIPPRKDAAKIDSYALRDSLEVFNRWLIENALNHRWRYVNFSAVLSDESGYLREDLSVGAIDPDAEGYRLMASEVSRVLNALD